jgi:hypothetical protein
VVVGGVNIFELKRRDRAMTIDQGIGLAGIIIAVILGIFAVKKIVNRSRTQNQKVGIGGTGVQAGRDATINK